MHFSSEQKVKGSINRFCKCKSHIVEGIISALLTKTMLMQMIVHEVEMNLNRLKFNRLNIWFGHCGAHKLHYFAFKKRQFLRHKRRPSTNNVSIAQ